jgi:hypothetical protein
MVCLNVNWYVRVSDCYLTTSVQLVDNVM